MTHPERSWLQPHTKLSEEPLPDEAEASPVVDLRIVGDDQETEVCLSILAALEAQSKEIKTNELNNSGVAVFRPPSYLEFDGPLYVLGAAVESFAPILRVMSLKVPVQLNWRLLSTIILGSMSNYIYLGLGDSYLTSWA